jgi:hypothetical protein
MSTPLVSPRRRVIARTCYYTATALTLVAFAMLFIAFQGSLWVASLFAALALIITGNAVSAPSSCRKPAGTAEHESQAPSISATTPASQHG